MKVKRIIAALLSAAFCLSFMSGCGKSGQNEQSAESIQSVQSSEEKQSVQSEEKSDEQSEQSEKTSGEESSQPETNLYTLYIRDQGKNSAITASFLNSVTGQKEDIAMNKVGEDGDCFIYSCDGDTSKYNMVHLTYGDNITRDVAFNNCVSGWYLWNDELLPCSKDKEPNYTPKYETKTLKFNDSDINVYIWTPDGYDANSADKYSTVYVFDGQTVLSTEISHDIHCWNVAESVDSMTTATGNKAILVAVETEENRGDNLVPDLGELNDVGLKSNKKGTEFSDFVCNTVVPFIQQNYNVYTDALHTSISGSSLGGLETFFIGMEHPEVFGTAGVLSASFQAFPEETWAKYLSEKTYDDNSAFMYFYAGRYIGDNGNVASAVYNQLIEAGYPKDKLVYSKYETGTHNIPFWRSIYPEFLEAMFMRKVSALECAVPVEYKDKSKDSNLEEKPESLPDLPSISPEDDTRPDEIKYYVFYDNSETKWENVYAYWWASNGPAKNVITDEIYMEKWPGFKMEQIEGTDFYRVVAPVDATNIIFNSGVSDEDVMKGVYAYQTTDLGYNYAAHSGKVFKIDTSTPPRPEKGFEKTKYKYSAGGWTDFTYPE